jgi:hypothetical protein
MKLAIGVVQILLFLLITQPSHAVSRHYFTRSPFDGRTAVGGFMGVGLPVGDFSDGRLGNHDAGGLDWSLEVEHYFGSNFSLGFSFTAGSYDDKDFGDELQTNLNTFGGYFKYVFVTNAQVHPFLRFGLGSMEVEFDSDEEIVDASRSEALNIAGGIVWMLHDNVSVNGQATYTHGWTEDAYISEADAIVGFDVSYWALDFGVSVYFP